MLRNFLLDVQIRSPEEQQPGRNQILTLAVLARLNAVMDETAG